MSDTKEQVEMIMKKIEGITSQITEETIKNASAEDLQEYLSIMAKITAKLVNLESIE